MKIKSQYIYHFLFLLCFLTGCKSSVKERKDEVYSRHLQRHVALTIISTTMPDDKSEMNLLLFNNADELKQIEAKKIIDNLYEKKLLQPLLLVGIHGKKQEEYGMSKTTTEDKNSKADKYNSFVINELYPFIRKKAVIRKFHSIAICGSLLAGLSAFDIAWQNADKIDKAGIFSGDFHNEALAKISSSRKRPELDFWLYAAQTNDTTILHNTKELIGIINKKNTGASIGIQFISDKNGNNDPVSWHSNFAAFLIWAFGK